MIHEHSNCSICATNLVPVIEPRKVCKFCWKTVCEKCSCEKVNDRGKNKRMCDVCFQDSLQAKTFTSSNYDMVQLLFELELKRDSRKELEKVVRKVRQEIADVDEEIEGFNEFEVKELQRVQEKKEKMQDNVKSSYEATKMLDKSIVALKTIKIEKKMELERVNLLLIQINEEGRDLEDKILESQQYVKNIKKENQFLETFTNQEVSEFKIEGKRLEKKIIKNHRKTMDSLEMVNYNNALMKARIEELKKILEEKKEILENITRSYRDTSLNSKAESFY